jgi:SAM-dependent methyltransferase
MPEDLQGWNSDSKIFDDLILEVKPKVIIEVGTWKGRSAIHMADVVKANKIPCSYIYCVDTWLGAIEFWTNLAHTPERDLLLKNGYPQVYYQFISNVIHHKHQDIIVPFPNTSTTAAKFFATTGVAPDLVYIDASHEYSDVLEDIRLYYWLLNPGGVLFGDDYFNFNGVKDAVDVSPAEHQVLYDNFWVMRK